MKRLLPLLALALLVALALGPSLRGEFVWDDAPLIVDNNMIKDPAQMGSILTSSFWETGDLHDRFRSFFRPVVSLSYALDYAIWELNPHGFHLTNLLLHLICCWLVFRIAAREGVSAWAALAGAALFAVHPVHVESVAWISGRTDLLCALFMLAAFLAQKRWRLVALLLFALALFSKEMAATLPLLIFGERLLRERKLRPAWAAAWPFLIVLGLYLVARSLVLAGGGAELFSLGPIAYAATALFVVGRYLTLLIMPVGLDAHYPYLPLDSLLAPLALLSALMLLVMVAAAWLLARRSPRGLYWLGWIFVSLLPVLAFGRFGDVLLADRFLYLPSVGLALLVALWLPAIPLRRAVAVVVIVLVVALTALSARRCLVWHDGYTLFSDMARTSSHSGLVRYNLGLALYDRNEYGPAIDEFRAAVALSPSYSLAHNNLAAALEREGEYAGALASYREALRLAPALVEAGANGGNLLVRMGRVDEGLQLLNEIVALHPRSAVALYALADGLDRTGRPDAALPLLERANRADPDHAETYYLLGKIHAEQGRPEEAAAAMHRFLELWDVEGEHTAAARRIISEGTR
jgi:tetratricopeptide (TPR) repeat protein